MSRYRVLAFVGACMLLLLGAVLLVRTHSDSSPPGSAEPGARPSDETTKGGSAGSEIAPVQTLPESAPGSGASSGLPGLSKRPSKGALVSSLPRAASKRGSLVDGYPQRIVPVVRGGTIRSSSVSPGGGSLQVAVDVQVGADCDDVLRFYTLRLAKWGFAGSSAPAVGGSSAVDFRRSKDSLVVTVRPAAKNSCRYSVFGTLQTAKS